MGQRQKRAFFCQFWIQRTEHNRGKRKRLVMADDIETKDTLQSQLFYLVFGQRGSINT